MIVDKTPHLMILERLDDLGVVVNYLEAFEHRVKESAGIVEEQDSGDRILPLHDVLVTTPLELGKYTERLHRVLVGLEDSLYNVNS